MAIKSESCQPTEIKQQVRQCLSAQDKLSLYQDYHRSDNKSEVARKWGINRSYMYEVVKECEALILSGMSQRRRGRKSNGESSNLSDAQERIKNLEEENRRLDEERERYYVRNEFMKVRLKWAEKEAGQLRGDVDADSDEAESCTEISKNRKKHLKKKRKQKR